MDEQNSNPDFVTAVIRPPEGYEHRICRMLLREISYASGEVWFRVAIDHASQRIVGAVGVREDLSQLPRWIIDAHVIPPFRRRGIGRLLIESTAVEAMGKGVGVLDSWVLPEDASDAFLQIQKFGFTSYKKIFEFEADGLQVLSNAQVLYERVVERGGIPPSAKLISLKDADMAQVIGLHTAYLGGTADGLLPRMGGGTLIPFDPHLSVVLMVDNQVMGFAMGHVRADPRVFEYDALVIHPRLRGGWAAAWLRYEQCRRGFEAGCRIGRYMTFDPQLGARHSSKRVPNRLVQTTCWMRRRLPSAGEAAVA